MISLSVNGNDENKLLIVNEIRFPVNVRRLSRHSPLFEAMFSVEMREKRAAEVPIVEVANAEHFGDFLAEIQCKEIAGKWLNGKFAAMLSNCRIQSDNLSKSIAFSAWTFYVVFCAYKYVNRNPKSLIVNSGITQNSTGFIPGYSSV